VLKKKAGVAACSDLAPSFVTEPLPDIGTSVQGCQDGKCYNCSEVFGSAADIAKTPHRYHLRMRKPDVDNKVSIRVAINYPPQLPSIRPGAAFFAENSRGAGAAGAVVREKDVFIAHVAQYLSLGEDELLNVDVEVPEGVRCPVLFIADECSLFLTVTG